MSAYGVIKKSESVSDPLPATIWQTSLLNILAQVDRARQETISVHHLTLETARKYDGLLEYLHATFEAVVDEGMTYPQEGEMNAMSFQSYFFSADLFLGLVSTSGLTGASDGSLLTTIGDLDSASKDWKSSIAGFYYIKPNYPGRSSHICNGGFVVPPVMRGRKFGKALGKSFLHYAPRLGYQASVFNLVYVNNVASVKIWEGLGFTKAGRIPSAGRLKRRDGEGEEFVDALIFYKRFSEE